MTNFTQIISLSLLMGSTFITNAMDTLASFQSQSPNNSNFIIVNKQAVKREYDLLKNSLDLFEADKEKLETLGVSEGRKWELAYKGFKPIHDDGGFVGAAYMGYMEQKGYVTPSVIHGHFIVEAIPEIGQDLSKQYLSASLAYMEPEIKAKVKKLAILALNNNAHAVSLMYKLCKDNVDVFSLLLKEKGFDNKKYKSLEDLFSNFQPKDKPIICWNCLDPSYLVYLNNNKNKSPLAKHFTETELTYFATNYEKTPHLLGKLAHKLATSTDPKIVNQPLFWAHLALENGWGGFCGQLGRSFLDQMIKLKRLNQVKKYTHQKKPQIKQQTNNINLSSEERNCLELSRYYTYHIQENDVLPKTAIFKLMQIHGADYEKGSYGDQNNLKSYYFDKKAADLGDLVSQYNVALKLRDGNGIAKDSRKALKYFKLAAAQNNTDAQFNLGIMYRDGDGIEADIEEALHYFKLAEDNGDLEAKTAHISLLFKAKKDRESLKIYADQGDLAAQRKYGAWLYEIASNSQNLQESNEYFAESRYYLELPADQNDKLALYNLAFMLYHGVGGKPNLPKARGNFKKAADQGMVQAQHNFAAMMYLGEGGDQDIKGAEEYYQKAASQGLVEAVIALQSIKEEASRKEIGIKESLILGDNSDEVVEIVLPSLQDDTEVDFIDNDMFGSVNSTIPLVEKYQKETQSPNIETACIETINIGINPPLNAIKEQEKETNHLIAKHNQEIAELRAKKLSQKRAAELSKQTLKMKKKDYEEIIKNPCIKKADFITKKSSVKSETLEFVNTIFSIKGAQKINAYSAQAARQAFYDLGCEVSNKKGENSTKIKFTLGNWVVKFKFHNPHELGEDLYDALKPYVRRFLESIHKTPDTLK